MQNCNCIKNRITSRLFSLFCEEFSKYFNIFDKILRILCYYMLKQMKYINC